MVNGTFEDPVEVMMPKVQVEEGMGKADICWLDKHKWQQRSRDQVTAFFHQSVAASY